MPDYSNFQFRFSSVPLLKCFESGRRTTRNVYGKTSPNLQKCKGLLISAELVSERGRNRDIQGENGFKMTNLATAASIFSNSSKILAFSWVH